TLYHHSPLLLCLSLFTATATTEIYTLSLHDALPISRRGLPRGAVGGDPRRQGRADGLPVEGPRLEPQGRRPRGSAGRAPAATRRDRKSTRLNSSHLVISYAVFCLKKKKKRKKHIYLE